MCHSYNVNLNIKGTFSGSDGFTTSFNILLGGLTELLEYGLELAMQVSCQL